MTLHEGQHRTIGGDTGTAQVRWSNRQAIEILTEEHGRVEGLRVRSRGAVVRSWIGVLEVNFERRPFVSQKVAYQAADGRHRVFSVLATRAQCGVVYLVDVVGGDFSGEQLHVGSALPDANVRR